MVNKKGWIRIVEASVAILIVFGALVVFRTNESFSSSRDLSEKIYPILDEIANNSSLRGNVLDYNLGAGETNSANAQILVSLKKFIQSRLDRNLNFKIRICETEEICGLSKYPDDAGNNLYSSERIISSSVEKSEFSPRKIKMFLWEKTN